MMLNLIVGLAALAWTAAILFRSKDDVRRFFAVYALPASFAVMVSPALHVAPGSWGVISLLLFGFWDACRCWSSRLQVRS